MTSAPFTLGRCVPLGLFTALLTNANAALNFYLLLCHPDYTRLGLGLGLDLGLGFWLGLGLGLGLGLVAADTLLTCSLNSAPQPYP